MLSFSRIKQHAAGASTAVIITMGVLFLGALTTDANGTGIESFEAPAVPTGCMASAGGTVAITGERFKSGGKSLVWTWSQAGSSMVCAAPGGAVPAPANQCLAFWLYSERPMASILRMELLREGAVVGNCWYVLNFRGWRPLGAPYGQVLSASIASPSVDSFRLIAPQGVPEGRLYLDLVTFPCAASEYRFSTAGQLFADDQQPWVGRPELLATEMPERFIYSSLDIAQNRPWLPARIPESEISAEQWRDLATMEQRCLSPDPVRRGYLQARQDTNVLAEYNAVLGIRRDAGGILTGRPVIPAKYWGTSTFNDPPDGVEAGGWLDRLVSAYLYEKAQKSEQVEKLKQACFDLCDHLLDQGYADGNFNISCSGFGGNAILSLREELAATGRLRDMLLASIGCTLQIRGHVLTLEDWGKSGYFPRNTDIYGSYRQMLSMILCLPDPADRLQRLQAYSRAISSLCDPTLGEPYAWDGTTHHHPMFHIAYCGGTLVQEAYDLRGTMFRVTPEAMAVLKRGILAYAAMAGSARTVPPNIPGYTGQPLTMGRLPDLAVTLAYCETAEARDGVDPDAAAIYLAMPGYDTTNNTHAVKFRALGVEPYRFDGHTTLNGAALALHRRDHWLVSIAGQFKFRRPYEANGTYVASAFNHYSRNGSVFVVSTGRDGGPPSPWDSGFSLEGWDSRQVPGTTSYLGQREKELQNYMGGNNSAFGGGTDLDGDGIWGLELIRENASYPDNLRLHRSAFCFGNRITLITTGIGRGPGAGEQEKSLPIATTLFQNAFGSGGETELTQPSRMGGGRFGSGAPRKPALTPPVQEPCWIDGRKVEDFPFEEMLPDGAAHWLVDNKRTGYFVPAGNPPLRVARRDQSWNYLWHLFAKNEQPYPKGDERNYEATTGQFAVAWFEHGTAPEATECVYTLIPETTPEKMKEFSEQCSAFAKATADKSVNGDQSGKEPPYRILEKDDQAHILWDRDSKTMGYVIFNPAWRSSGQAAIRNPQSEILSVSRPCSVMVREGEADTLHVSVASTDLDGWPQWAASPGRVQLSGSIKLTLAGGWDVARVEAATPRVCGTTREKDRTVIDIPFKDFMPVRLTLRAAGDKEQAP